MSLTGKPLTKGESQRVADLKKRDAEVRAHEAAHLSTAGSLAQGGPRFTYATGPDGREYAVGGEVPVSLAPGKTPEETIARAERLRAAALAPADPSGPDRAIAAQAASMEAQARAELGKKTSEQAAGSETDAAPSTTNAQGSRPRSSDSNEAPISHTGSADSSRHLPGLQISPEGHSSKTGGNRAQDDDATAPQSPLRIAQRAAYAPQPQSVGTVDVLG